MQLFFFSDDGHFSRLYDRRVIRFNSTPDLPAPPHAFLMEHFRQAVLANMRGAGQVPDLDFDPKEDGQSMSVFESGEGKRWLERELADKLIPGIDDGPARELIGHQTAVNS